jgi:acetylornithine deacetylase/succinyl-diaminopimelate desuccinylase-like protein
MQTLWSESITRVTGVSVPRRLPSGAGHDAMMMASLAPIGMLFVRCGNGGISHNPAESLDPKDAEIAAHAFEDFLIHFSAEA